MNDSPISMSDEELEAAIRRVGLVIEANQRHKVQLEQEQSKRRSLAAIRFLGITRANVQSRDAEGLPCFPHLVRFAEWLKQQSPASRKRFCEWNGLVYLTSELIEGRTEHVAEYEYVPDK